MKVQIPVSVQKLIKCSNCNKLLSCGPVFLVHETSDAICGRCSPQDTESSTSEEIRSRTRNIQYEETAKLLSFPCSFADRGCTQQLNFSSNKPNAHELDCEFRSFICPIVDCNWIRHPCHLTEHCRDAHPSHLFVNNCSVPKLDLICKSTGKLYHSIRMIGESGFIENFVYSLAIEGNDENFTKRGSILHRGKMVLQEPTSTCININSLFDILGGKYNEAKFTIKIQTTVTKCVNCLKAIDTASNSMFCKECEGKLIKCEFHAKGCLFVDFNQIKCDKHKIYFCTYRTECYNFFCKNIFVNYSCSSSPFCGTLISINSVVRLTESYTIENYILFSSNYIGTIICKYDLSNSNLKLWLNSSLPWHELKNFKCSVELTDPRTKQTKLLTPQILDNERFDWFIEDKMNNIPFKRNIKLDLKLKIYK